MPDGIELGQQMLSWSSAQEYLRALPDAKLLYLDGSGHNAFQYERRRHIAEVRAFYSLGTFPSTRMWAGAPVGIAAMIGILLLNLRRWFVQRVRANTDTIRFVTDACCW
jgi:hypothetical protein